MVASSPVDPEGVRSGGRLSPRRRGENSKGGATGNTSEGNRTRELADRLARLKSKRGSSKGSKRDLAAAAAASAGSNNRKSTSNTTSGTVLVVEPKPSSNYQQQEDDQLQRRQSTTSQRRVGL